MIRGKAKEVSEEKRFELIHKPFKYLTFIIYKEMAIL